MATIKKLKSGRWNVQIRVKGHAPLPKTFRTKAETDRWAVQIEAQIRSGSHIDTGQAHPAGMAEHLAWYPDYVSAHNEVSDRAPGSEIGQNVPPWPFGPLHWRSYGLRRPRPVQSQTGRRGRTWPALPARSFAIGAPGAPFPVARSRNFSLSDDPTPGREAL